MRVYAILVSEVHPFLGCVSYIHSRCFDDIEDAKIERNEIMNEWVEDHIDDEDKKKLERTDESVVFDDRHSIKCEINELRVF